MYARPTGMRFETARAALSPYAPDDWRIQIHRGMAFSTRPFVYDPDMTWDPDNFIVDRYVGSLSGGLGELAVMMSGMFDQREIRVCLSKYEQHDRGLDFEYKSEFHQVKSGIITFSGGALKVSPQLFTTHADYLHVVTKGNNPQWWMGPTSKWVRAVEELQAAYEAEEQSLPDEFTLEANTILNVGIQQFPIFSWASA
jgi:hypothetical protein